MVRKMDRRHMLSVTLGAGLTLTGGRLVAAQATPAASPVASPVAGAAGSGPARLLAMLGVAPAHALSTSGAIWADLASALQIAKLAPFGAATTTVDRAHQEALRNLALPQGPFDYALVPDYARTFGFSPFQMEQALQLGDPPNTITFLRGPWNASALTRAWVANAYKEIKSEAGTVWSWADGPKINLQSPVSRFGLGKMNNASILPDGTVVFAGSIALVTQVLRTANGNEPSLAGDRRIAGLVESTPKTLVSALVAPGASLQNSFDPARVVLSQKDPVAAATEAARQRQEEQQAVGVMPQPSFGLLGVTGGLDDAHIIVRLAENDGAEADRAAKIMAYRLAHAPSLARGRPFSDLLTLVSAEGQANPPVAKAEFAPKNTSASIWYDMYYQRDLGLVGWGR